MDRILGAISADCTPQQNVIADDSFITCEVSLRAKHQHPSLVYQPPNLVTCMPPKFLKKGFVTEEGQNNIIYRPYETFSVPHIASGNYVRGLQKLYNSAERHIRCLTALNVPTLRFSATLVNIMCNALMCDSILVFLHEKCREALRSPPIARKTLRDICTQLWLQKPS